MSMFVCVLYCHQENEENAHGVLKPNCCKSFYNVFVLSHDILWETN